MRRAAGGRTGAAHSPASGRCREKEGVGEGEKPAGVKGIAGSALQPQHPPQSLLAPPGPLPSPPLPEAKGNFWGLPGTGTAHSHDSFHLRTTSEDLVLDFLFFSTQEPHITGMIPSVMQKEKPRHTHRLRSAHPPGQFFSSTGSSHSISASPVSRLLEKNGCFKNLISRVCPWKTPQSASP